ncbi:putative aldouronate transport system substrate-binding protein [Paenibacillus algorifonticola]|uniref:Putative aldouronate transport system substrate-binding protein n=1 Tax=Paenibacillus algorifonticola TaxID=684063 RepID=A0A1I2FUQ5_9BACL|nr:extracellular solute-binding protein [Paenibacillus algorifonticola]SFF08693.1 putative aldouronate transport system substrate-binding protein [Paenibacillus algorifonticola]
MNRRHRMIALIVIILFISACSSSKSSNPDTDQNARLLPDSSGKYESPVTIRIGTTVESTKSLLEGETLVDNQYTRNIKNNLNIIVDYSFKASPANYNQKVSLAIASGDLPDAMVVGPVELKEMIEADQLMDLTEVYHTYASPVIKRIVDSTDGEALNSVTFNGKILALPNVQLRADGVHLLWIRKDWLDKLHMEPPQTMEELEAAAQAFVEQDPDGNNERDTIGLAGPSLTGRLYANFLHSTNNLYGFDGIFAAYDAYPGYWLEDSGKVVYGSVQPGTKEALGKLREMYLAGLIDPEMGVREDPGESIVSGKTGMFFAPWWAPYGPIDDAVRSNPEANWQAYALPLNRNGEYRPHMSTSTSQFVVVRKGYEHPEAAMLILNNLVLGESQGTFTTERGPTEYPLRLTYAPTDETEYEVKALRQVLAGTSTAEDFLDKPEYKMLLSDIRNIGPVKLGPYDKYDIKYWAPDKNRAMWIRGYSLMVGGSPLVDNEINGIFSATYAQTKTMESRWPKLQRLEEETFLKIILGAAPLDAFDQFTEEWIKQGGEQITREVNELNR